MHADEALRADCNGLGDAERGPALHAVPSCFEVGDELDGKALFDKQFVSKGRIGGGPRSLV